MGEIIVKCQDCRFYEESPLFNECKLLKWECCRVSENCTCVNDDGTINEKEFKKAEEFI